MHFLVFGGRKWENVMGKKGVTWEIIGIFESDDPDTACLRGMQKSGVGTAFAVAGYAFGVDTIEADKSPELGVDADPVTRLERMGEKMMEKLTAALPPSKPKELERGDSDDA